MQSQNKTKIICYLSEKYPTEYPMIPLIMIILTEWDLHTKEFGLDTEPGPSKV